MRRPPTLHRLRISQPRRQAMPQRRPHPSRRLRRPRRLRLTVSIARLPNTAPTARFRLNRPSPCRLSPRSRSSSRIPSRPRTTAIRSSCAPPSAHGRIRTTSRIRTASPRSVSACSVLPSRPFPRRTVKAVKATSRICQARTASPQCPAAARTAKAPQPPCSPRSSRQRCPRHCASVSATQQSPAAR